MLNTALLTPTPGLRAGGLTAARSSNVAAQYLKRKGYRQSRDVNKHNGYEGDVLAVAATITSVTFKRRGLV